MMPAQQPVFVEYISPDGKPYFYNTLTKGTQWERPPPHVTVVKAPPQPKQEPRPASFFSSLNTMTASDKPGAAYVVSLHIKR